MNHSDEELLDRLRKAAEQLLNAYDAMDDALREGLPVGRTPQRRLTAACALIQVPERRLLTGRHSGVPRLRLQVQSTPNDAHGADDANDARLAMVIDILAEAFNDKTVEPTEVLPSSALGEAAQHGAPRTPAEGPSQGRNVPQGVGSVAA